MFSYHRDTTYLAISLLLHTTQRSQRFPELIIIGVDLFESGHDYNKKAEFHFGHLLATNIQLGIILTSQLELLHFEHSAIGIVQIHWTCG